MLSILTVALRKPIAILVLTLGISIFSIFSLLNIPIDVLPKLNLPTIYIIESYGGMSAQQMEGFFATGFQDQLLYVSGVKEISSRSIQGVTIVKLTFHEDTDMAEAAAEVALMVNRSMKFFPTGALPPHVMRFDASSLPIGQLVFSSPTKSLKEINDLAATRIRPMFATVPGLSAPAPFGSNSRSVVVNVDPDKLRSYNLTPDQIVEAIAKNNAISPSGNLRVGNMMYLATINSLEQKVEEFGNIPIFTEDNHSVFVRDVARVADAADVTVNYALVNGQRSVYIPIVKTAKASTWNVADALKKKIPEMQSLLPDDVQISYEFDQSVSVMNSVESLITEGVLGAVLTGLMVLLFLGDFRSSIIVIITIPIAVISAVLFLSLAGQTINIMTLSGLALAIGVLVDESTVTIENVHQHLEMGKSKRQAIFDACAEIALPKLLILLCILAVFAPSFIMSGVPRAMFLPLALSIGFAMIVSFLLSQTLVPVLCNWMLKAEKFKYKHGQPHAHAGLALDDEEVKEIELHLQEEMREPEKNDRFERFKLWYKGLLDKWIGYKKLTVSLYLLLVVGLAGLAFVTIGKDLMPKVNSSQFQVRLKMPDGTRLERTEAALKQALKVIDSVSQNQVAITSAYVGLVPSNYGSSNLFVFNSGTHEASLQVNLSEEFEGDMELFKDELRQAMKQKIPQLRISFEPIDLTEKTLSQGAPSPIEIQVASKDLSQIQTYVDGIMPKIKELPYLRDVQIAQPLRYPVIRVNVDRLRAAQMGVDVVQIARSVTDATSSSRFTDKIQWLDEKAAYTYQLQVQIPEYIMNDLNDLKSIPIMKGQLRPVLQDVATFSIDTMPAQYDRMGPRRFVSINANLHQKDLASATADMNEIIASMGEPPKGMVVSLRGTASLLVETFEELQNGLLAAILVIFLLLASNYQSFRLSLAVLSTIPAVLLGALLFLHLTGSTLNLQSYMGIIMSTGVSVANAILIVTNAEKLRLEYRDASKAAVVSAAIRLRPILMTSLAMMAGMIPMASGLGEAGDQSAPLGRAVIGGLFFSTLAALLVLPQVYAWIQSKTSYESPSLMPEETQTVPQIQPAS